MATGYCTRTVKGDAEWVRRVALSDDGEMLASCGNDQSVKVGRIFFPPDFSSSFRCFMLAYVFLLFIRRARYFFFFLFFSCFMFDCFLVPIVVQSLGVGGTGMMRRRPFQGCKDKTVSRVEHITI